MERDDRTIRAYEERMDRYLAAQQEPPTHVIEWIERFAAVVGPGGTVLEPGSGPGADADRLEALGLRVRRSDAAAAFVERLQALGHDAQRIDVRSDPLPGPVDGVFANAVLLHLEREELASAFERIRDALRPGGVLACSLKEGDGAEWHDRKLGVPRRFTYWREGPLREALATAGFTDVSIEPVQGRLEPWLQVLARA